MNKTIVSVLFVALSASTAQASDMLLSTAMVSATTFAVFVIGSVIVSAVFQYLSRPWRKRG